MHDPKKALAETKAEIENIKADAKLIVVSKKKSADQIAALVECGQVDFGENYVQEFCQKYEDLKDSNLRWHFIGQLQTNKVKQIIGKVFMIHSVDSVKLLKEIDKRAANLELVQKILLQVSFSNEKGRGGIDEEKVISLVTEALSLENVEICGLMTVPPIGESDYKPRPYFKSLKDLLHSLQNQFSLNSKVFCELSMGMSSDYKEALEEGATYIRIGSKILGSRT
jgi:pyridoxal phosphate enzyme (YggS family)